MEELKPGQGGEGKQRDDDLFSLGDSGGEPELVAKRLSILKKETAREADRKQQHKRAEKQAVAKEAKKKIA